MQLFRPAAFAFCKNLFVFTLFKQYVQYSPFIRVFVPILPSFNKNKTAYDGAMLQL